MDLFHYPGKIIDIIAVDPVILDCILHLGLDERAEVHSQRLLGIDMDGCAHGGGIQRSYEHHSVKLQLIHLKFQGIRIGAGEIQETLVLDGIEIRHTNSGLVDYGHDLAAVVRGFEYYEFHHHEERGEKDRNYECYDKE